MGENSDLNNSSCSTEDLKECDDMNKSNADSLVYSTDTDTDSEVCCDGDCEECQFDSWYFSFNYFKDEYLGQDLSDIEDDEFVSDNETEENIVSDARRKA
ncbi:hypothetical protein TcasGA2_TC032087 [Tribolium castaneum]|uniref:Uncharacterized protein n=1 Tax=Tribolium castaneum TaxID=7070 RepID=A0A139WML8_TRICA|nr:hypothetical protein TcasGA2_TC032087 [Tribolium castaneum]